MSGQMKVFWQQIPSPLISEMLASSSVVDGVVLDLEHGCFNNETIFNCIQIIDHCGKSPFVRVPTIDERLVRMCLDAGADGIIFANINRMDQVRRINEICSYPHRGVGYCRENEWGRRELCDKVPIQIIQIENNMAIKNLPSIATCENISCFMIGPYDLSKSCGKAGDFESENFKYCMKEFHRIVPEYKRGYHLVTDMSEYYLKYNKYGFMAFSLDTLMIKNNLKELEEWLSIK